jgi:two-component system, LytTR family, sensor kinase
MSESRIGGRSRVAVVLLASLLAVLAALVASARGGMMISDGIAIPIAWPDRFVGALFEFGWWVPVGLMIVAMVRRISGVRRSPSVQLLGYSVLGVLSIVLYFLLRATVHLPGDDLRLGFTARGFLSQLPSSVGMYLLIAMVGGLYMALTRSRERERETAALALRTSQLETQLVEAQLGVLRAQLHPHFLFNALHAVSALVDWRPKEARRMLAQLSDLLRMALEFSEQREITVAREMEWLDHYIELQTLRYGDRLGVHLHVEPEATTALVPPLVLQPLLENAIKYAIEPRQTEGRIEVIAERAGKWLRLTVRDDGPGVGTATSGTGVGLKNTRDRLHTIYGDAQQVYLRKRDAGGTDAVVELPFRSASVSAESLEKAG